MIGKYLTGPWIRLIKQPSFVACALILLICAAALLAGKTKFEMYLSKDPVEIQKSFMVLDQDDALAPYKVINKRRSPPEIETELGTTEYIDWTLEDTSASPTDQARYIRLFVSYYTGNSGTVPHVSEICLTANGGSISNEDNLTITVPDCGQENAGDILPIRVMDVEFPPINNLSQQQTVTYFFSANSDYLCTRLQVRDRLNNWRDQYAYFSKVEISLAGPDKLSREEAMAAVEKLCRIVVPILWSEYWPDWEKLNSVEESHDPGESIDFPEAL